MDREGACRPAAHAPGAQNALRSVIIPSPNPKPGSSWSRPRTRTSSKRRSSPTTTRATWRTGSFQSCSPTKDDFDRLHISPGDFAAFLKKVDSGEISGRLGKDILRKAFAGKKGLVEIIEEEGLKQVTDRGAIEAAVDDVIRANPGQADEYRSGKSKVLGWFVGEVMKATKGKASPGVVNELLKEKLK